jgi:kumamolisin
MEIPAKEALMPTPQERRSLANSEITPLPKARLIGKADANETVQVTVIVRRKQGAPPLPDQDYWMRTPPGRRKFLSPDEFAAQYGAEQKDIDTVADFGRSNGLTVLEAHAGRRSVILTGTVAQMNAAFGIDMQYYEAPSPRPSRYTLGTGAAPTQTYRGYSGAISLPQAVADLAEVVAGLDNRRTGGRNITWTDDDPPNISTLTVPQVVTTYDFPNNSATGQMIGIVSMEGGYDPAEVTSYFHGLGRSAPTIIPRSVNGGANRGNDFETLQDICICATVAVGATIVVYFVAVTSPTPLGEYEAWVNLLNRLLVPEAGETAPPVMTSSYFLTTTDDGTEVSAPNLNAISNMFQELATRGITFFISAGDKGSDDGAGNGKVNVQYPGSDPWVTSCGGTALGTDTNGALDETVWNDSWTVTQGGITDTLCGATGGGVSDNFELPAWQNAAGVPPSFNDGKVRRGVPDIAGNASPVSGYPMRGGGQPFNAGGTSAVAPLYAGLAACLNAVIGQPIGFLNPTLYALGNRVCRDITYGNNLWCVSATPYFYSAGPGWDACTGWGVVNGFALLNALTANLTPPPDPCADIIQRLNQEIQALGGIPVSTAAAWKSQLLSCLRQGKITEAQYTAAVNEIDHPPTKHI